MRARADERSAAKHHATARPAELAGLDNPVRWAGYFTAAKGRPLASMRIRELAEHPLGVTWVVDEALQRASHALVHDGRVWLVDPFDVPEAIERAPRSASRPACCSSSSPTTRDGEAIAKRLGVPFLALPDVVRDSPFSVLDVDKRAWKERALWWPEPRGLSSPESIGTAPCFAVGNGPAGVHPFRRAAAARPAAPFLPEHLLVGHGAPVHGGEAAAALLDALNRSRRDIPTLFWQGRD